ncbi:MAG: hypothetical protein V1716_01825 [Candidatus Uhrbacteria bacterium]
MPKKFESFSPVRIEMPEPLREKGRDVSEIDLPSEFKEQIEESFREKKPMVIFELEGGELIDLLQALVKKWGWNKMEVFSPEDFASRVREILNNRMSERRIVVVDGIDNFDDEALLPCFRMVRAQNETAGSEKQTIVVFIGSVGARADFDTINHPLLNLTSFVNSPAERRRKLKLREKQ